MKSSQTHLGLVLLRVGFAGLMLTHGIPKLQKLLAGNIEFPEVFGLSPTISLILAVIGEFVAPVLVLIGFKTRWAAIPTIITMLVAAFVIHADDPFGRKEFPLLYAIGFTAILLLGSGKYSLDNYLSKK